MTNFRGWEGPGAVEDLGPRLVEARSPEGTGFPPAGNVRDRSVTCSYARRCETSSASTILRRTRGRHRRVRAPTYRGTGL